MPTYDKIIKELQQFKEDVIAGYYVSPTALGPGKLSKNTIKAKTITGNMIDVSNLQAVNTNTGSLTVNGDLTIGTSGSLRSGKTAYSDTINSGFWLGMDGGTPKFRMGSTAQSILWDGATLTITGTITATSGTIGGWIIGSTDLTSDTGATGIASSGSYRLWIGNSTPASAVFSVTSAGLMKSRSGDIGGWTIDNVGIRLGSAGTERGMDTGSIAFYAGGSPGSAPFRVSTAGAVTATNVTLTGAITASSLSITGTASFSGGSMTLPNGGSITSSNVDLNQGNVGGMTIDGTLTLGSGGGITDSDGSTWNQTGITLIGADSIIFKYNSGTIVGKLTTLSTGMVFTYWNGTSELAGLTCFSNNLSLTGGSGSSDAILRATGNLEVRGRIYPGVQSGSIQTTYYIDSSIISNGIGIGGMLGISSGNTINLISPGSGGSASNWSSFGTANIPDASAGYFIIQIAGTNYRVPFYANG